MIFVVCFCGIHFCVSMELIFVYLCLIECFWLIPCFIFQGDTSSSLNSLNVSPAASPVLSCPIPSLPLPGLLSKPDNSKQTPVGLIFNYLLEAYSRVALEERNFPKKSSIPPLSELLGELRCQVIHYTALVLQGLIVDDGDSAGKPGTSLLLNPLLNQTLPRGFVSELVARTSHDFEAFSAIFSPLLQNLFTSMQNASIAVNEHRQPIQVLNELVEIRCGSMGNARPICKLITNQPQFLPEICTLSSGREISRSCYLGPFISVSVFAEDEPKVCLLLFLFNNTFILYN